MLGPVAAQILVNKDFLTDGPEPGEFDCIAGTHLIFAFSDCRNTSRESYAERLPNTREVICFTLSLIVALIPGSKMELSVWYAAIGFYSIQARPTASETRSRVSISHLAPVGSGNQLLSSEDSRQRHTAQDSPGEIVSARRCWSLATDCERHIARRSRWARIHWPHHSGRRKGFAGALARPAGIFVVSGSEAQSLRDAGASLVPAVDTDDIDPATDPVEKNQPGTRSKLRGTSIPVEAVLRL